MLFSDTELIDAIRGGDSEGVIQLINRLTELETSSDPLVLVLSHTVNLTDSQIKSLPTTEIDLLPAPGEGKIILPQTIVIGPWPSVAYTNVNALAQISFVLGGDDPMAQDTSIGNLIGSNLGNLQIVATYWQTKGNMTIVSEDVNAPLTVFVDNVEDGDFSGGDANNILPITIVYSICNLVN